MSHPVLSLLPADQQRREVFESRRHLGEMVERLPDSFAYPHGAPSDYTTDTARIVADVGFRRACAAVGGYLREPIDPFGIPRVMVENWTGAELADRLRTVLAVP